MTYYSLNQAVDIIVGLTIEDRQFGIQIEYALPSRI